MISKNDNNMDKRYHRNKTFLYYLKWDKYSCGFAQKLDS